MPCCCCEITDRTFGQADARADLRQYHKGKVPAHTSELLRVIRAQGFSGAKLIDVGGGVGVLHPELLKDVAASAIHVDASSAYLEAAQEEAKRLGQVDRVQFIHADFTDVSRDVAAAEIVTLDRVVCCYPDARTLLDRAAERCRQAFGLTYPRDVWYVRWTIGLINLLQRIRRDPFRVFLHSPKDLDAILRAAGLRRISLRRFAVWEVALYLR